MGAENTQYDLNLYSKLVENLYQDNQPITLPAEYAYFFKDNLLRLLIRLARYKFIAKMIKKEDNVLEIGCGSGVGSIFLSQNCHNVFGIDLKEHEINEAKSINRRDNVRFACQNFFDFNENDKYDTIICLDVIEHLHPEDGEKLIKKTLQHIHKNGMLIIGTPSIYSYEYQGELSKAAHIKCYDRDELVTLMEKFYGRTLCFSMNDELVHTGFHKMAWYYFVIALVPKEADNHEC